MLTEIFIHCLKLNYKNIFTGVIKQMNLCRIFTGQWQRLSNVSLPSRAAHSHTHTHVIVIERWTIGFGNKRSLIVTNAKEELRTFEQYFGGTIGKAASAEQQWLSFRKTSSPTETIRQTASNCLQYDFNLAYVRLPNAADGAEAKRQPTTVVQPDNKQALAKSIDGWVDELHTALSLNGLLVVMFVGANVHGSGRNNRIGVAMVQTKKPPKWSTMLSA